MKYTLVFTIFFCSLAIADTWVTMPHNGKNYPRESKCPKKCYKLPEINGRSADYRDYDLSNGRLVLNVSRARARASAEKALADARQAKLDRIAELKAKSDLNESEVKEALKLILERL